MPKLQSLVYYFESNIRNHKRVEDFGRIKSGNEDEYIYEIQRRGDLPALKVHISDAYEYGPDAYAARPREIKPGDFILVDSFGPGANKAVVEQARRDRVAIGPWRKLFGALNLPDPSRYRMPEEKDD